MSLVIGLLTFLLVVNSLLLILLILIQLPKKEAGAGLAFGGGTTDALFGAGSGNVLTKVTKYATGIFLALSLTLSILHTHRLKSSGRGVLSELERKASAAAVTPPPTTTTPSNSAVSLFPPATTNLILPPAKAPASNATPAKLPTK